MKVTKLHIEASSFCNARCPGCPRNAYGYPLEGFYKETHLKPEKLTELLQKFSDVQSILYCGNHGDPMMNFLSGRTVCDYDEVGRVISEKYHDSINFDAKITVETSFYWSEGTVMIEVKDYMYGDHEKDFVSSRRVVQMM